MNKKASYAFRILAGAYLVYLGYSLVKGYLVEHEVSAGFLVIGVLFGALGLFFCVTGLLGRRQADQELKKAQEEYDSLMHLPVEEPESRTAEADADSENSGSPSIETESSGDETGKIIAEEEEEKEV